MARFYEITCGSATVFHGKATLAAVKKKAQEAAYEYRQPAIVWRSNHPSVSRRKEKAFVCR